MYRLLPDQEAAQEEEVEGHQQVGLVMIQLVVGLSTGKIQMKPIITMSNFSEVLTIELKYISMLPKTIQYRKTPNISCTLVGNKIVDNSDVVGASPVGAAPNTSSFST